MRESSKELKRLSTVSDVEHAEAVLRYSFICASSRCKLNPGGLQAWILCGFGSSDHRSMEASMKPGQRAEEEDRSAVMLVEAWSFLPGLPRSARLLLRQEFPHLLKLAPGSALGGRGIPEVKQERALPILFANATYMLS